VINRLKKQEIKVLDIGGNHYRECWQRDYCNQSLEWTVLESQGVVEVLMTGKKSKY